MKLSIKAGSTSQTLLIFIVDSSSTTGNGLTDLVYNTSGLTCYYVRPRAAAQAVSLVTQTVGGAYATTGGVGGGFVEISKANMPGWYRFDVPDAALVAGVRSVGFHFKGAANMMPLPIEVELTAWDNQDAVHGGLSSLPNAAAGAANGLLTFGTGSGQLNPASGVVPANMTQADGVAYHNYDGKAQAGGASTITLQAGSSTVVGAYVGWRIMIVGGTGVGQSRVGVAYDTATLVLTVDTPWGTVPDNTSEYVFGTPADRTIIGSDGIVAASFATGAIDADAFTQGAADKVWSTATRTLSGVTFPTNFASTVIDSSGKVSVTLDATASAALADAILKRDTTTVQADMPKHCLGVLVHGLTKWTIQGTNLIILNTVTGAQLHSMPLTVGPATLGIVTGVDSAT